jgi:hypothetical protein
MGRYFTLDEAAHALPIVEKYLREALYLKSEYEQADSELKTISRNIIMMGGTKVNPGHLLSLREHKDQSGRKLQEKFDAIQETGCLVKDLDAGLIDFPTLYRGREVYLCWRFGEPGIEFWHGVEEGFRGRKPIDDEFRQNHRGDQVS